MLLKSERHVRQPSRAIRGEQLDDRTAVRGEGHLHPALVGQRVELNVLPFGRLAERLCRDGVRLCDLGMELWHGKQEGAEQERR